MENQLQQMGRRIRELRTLLDISPEDMAELHRMTVEEYKSHEDGQIDSSFTFILRCAQRFGVDISALVTGESPRLSSFILTRAGGGVPIKRRAGFEYLHQAAMMKDRAAEPFIVRAPYLGEQDKIHLSTHSGQEFDYIISGHLKVQIDDKVEIMGPGDSIYYDSGHPHGMISIGGEECVFLAVVIKSDDEQSKPMAFNPVQKEEPAVKQENSAGQDLIYKKFATETIDENGMLQDIRFHYPDNFNFAYDVLDALAEKCPDKVAMRWISRTHEVRNFTFKDISVNSCKTANFLTSLGIRKGDRVMLVMRRHYQFWYVMNALHRIGAIAVPAAVMLTEHDFSYRFNEAGIKAVVCTGLGETAAAIDAAMADSPTLQHRIIVEGERPGWICFNRELEHFDAVFPRPADHNANDPMALFFSSGTSGYPKMVLHTFTYPLGHIITARWWHCVDPNGLHLTISDTGWGKSLWGKLYGQWLCEAGILVYDFDRFHAEDILPLFKEHHITTFCAPPTMYRFFIKQDLSKYDFSSLQHVTIAGEALNPEVFQQFYQATGLKLMEGFGQTESTLQLANLRGMNPKPGSMGKPVPSLHIDLLDSNGKPVSSGDTGEICIRVQPNEHCGIFQQYYNNQEATDNAWHDGYYHTGDTAWRDEDGYYWYVGRTDDLIKSSGYRIGPFEVENVLMELPYVLECAVYGAPDPVRGQVVKASIVLRNGTEGTPELIKEIQAYVRENTAPYKYPRIVEFVSELPKTISGKIRRSALREQSKTQAAQH